MKPDVVCFRQYKRASVRSPEQSGKRAGRHDEKRGRSNLAESARNDVLPKIIPVVSYPVDLIGTVETVRLIVGHRAIRDAIAAHDAEAAGKAMRERPDANRRMIKDAVRSLTRE